MFWYDKDMERVMQHKKREILKELEDTKNRILKELSGVDKITLTRLREIIADYNKIDFNINNKINSVRAEVSDYIAKTSKNVESVRDYVNSASFMNVSYDANSETLTIYKEV